MCGIAGFINRNIDAPSVIKAMTDCMVERGPDSDGYWMDEQTGVTLGHRRLSILDLSENGAQPMISASARFVISYNGEIYNAQEIKRQLKQMQPGQMFRGTSDTEIILEAFEVLGIEETLQSMKGMFAIALYDRQEKCLVLMRDRAGEKPLYYGFSKESFIFSSDPEALRRFPDFPAAISREALALYMRYGFIPAPYSIYEGVYKLKPGCMLTISAPFQSDNVKENCYWSFEQALIRGKADPFTGSEEEAADCLEELLTEAIRGQMISDVPLGAFLSGGIDSPLIVSLMQKISDKPVQTFTIGFTEKKYNEAEFAKEIAAHLGTRHTELYVSEKELQDVIPVLAGVFKEPFADSSQIPTCLVSKLAKSQVTVALSGDAGDELFCGYNTYPKITSLYRRLSGIPSFLRQAGGMVLGLPGVCRMRQNYRISMSLKAKTPWELHEAVCYHTDYQAERLVQGAADRVGEAHHLPGLSEMETMMYKDMITYHPDDILVKVDRSGMAVSLENRVPMLDRDVMEFSCRLPIAYKYGENGLSKKVLKTILYRYVPKEMLDRPKKGFSVPLSDWLTSGETADWAKDMMNNSRLLADGYFDAKVFSGIWKQFCKDRRNTQIVWEILMAEQWYRRIKSS